MRVMRVVAMVLAVLTVAAVASAQVKPVVQKVLLKTATLADAQAKLLGEGGQPGLLAGGEVFEASFEQVSVATDDLPALRTLVKEAARLSSGSEVKIEGKLEGKNFEVKVERSSDGRMQVRLEGLTFDSEHQLLDLLGPLVGQSLKELKLEARVADRPIKIRMEQDAPKVTVTTTPTPKTDDAAPTPPPMLRPWPR